MTQRLEKLYRRGSIVNTFRLFFDLQNYENLEIPQSFLACNSIKFYLTEKNNEDMEGFNDVWANILNNDLLECDTAGGLTMLEPPSETITCLNLNIDSQIGESISID